MTSFASRKIYLTKHEGSGGEEGDLSAKQRNDLIKGLAHLPFVHAQIIVMHYFRDLPLAEIATLLKLDSALVDKMHYDALQRLKCMTK